jgi:CubicO group peptidase (beta-lactamase class C family)
VLAVFQMATGGRARADGGVDGGLDPLIFLETRLLQPIGIIPTAWARDSRNQPNFGGGASMTARAWAAYGQFLIDGGRVGGQQILSSDALARCTSYRNPAFLPYGLGFWLNRDAAGSVGPDDQAPVTSEVRNRWQTGGRYAPSVPDSMYFAWGAGNAKLFMLPSHGLVAAKIGGGGDDDRFLGILIGSQN